MSFVSWPLASRPVKVYGFLISTRGRERRRAAIASLARVCSFSFSRRARRDGRYSEGVTTVALAIAGDCKEVKREGVKR